MRIIADESFKKVLSKEFSYCSKVLVIFGEFLVKKKDHGKEKEYQEALQRLQAEFENFTKRTEKERQDYGKYLNASLLHDFLPLVDTLNEGIKHAEKSKNNEMKEGFEKAEKQLNQILERNGVRKIATTGKKFDSELHECMMTSHEKGKDDDEILEEFQKGYTLHEKTLRPAKVRINKKE